MGGCYLLGLNGTSKQTNSTHDMRNSESVLLIGANQQICGMVAPPTGRRRRRERKWRRVPGCGYWLVDGSDGHIPWL